MINLQYIICLRHISYLKTKMTTIDRDREEERDRRWGSFYIEVSFRFLLRYEDFVKISKKFMKYLIVTNDMKTRQDKTRHQWKRGRIRENAWWNFQQMASCTLLCCLKCFAERARKVEDVKESFRLLMHVWCILKAGVSLAETFETSSLRTS